jgi:hypothetical protein
MPGRPPDSDRINRGSSLLFLWVFFARTRWGGPGMTESGLLRHSAGYAPWIKRAN